jgi:hypothetical protein
MEPLVLTDIAVRPTEDLIFFIIGRNRVHWRRLIDCVRQKYPDTEEHWKYYIDGHSWLFRMIRKKKTLFWIGVLKDTFRVTFYFGDKAEPLIENSGLPKAMISDFKNGDRYGKIRSITIRIERAEDIDNCLKLVDVRVKAQSKS